MTDIYKSLKVLIVDDQKTLVWGIKKFLEERGFTVDEAFNGIEGEKKILSNSYDIVVIDLKLPEKSGLEVLSSVKGKVDSTFILISAFATAKDAERAAKLGASDFIPKPFSPDELLERISLLLNSATEKKKINTSLNWHTFFIAKGAVKVDVFYDMKNEFYVDASEKGDFFIANGIDDFKKGILHTAFEMSGSMSFFEEYVYNNEYLSNISIFTFNTTGKKYRFKGDLFCISGNKSILNMEKTLNGIIYLVGFGFNDKEQKILKEAVEAESIFEKPFSVYCFVKKSFIEFDNRILFVINFKKESGYFKVQEKILPEFVSEEGISRFLFSTPPSQKIKEERKRELKLLVCEIAAELKSELKLQPLDIFVDYNTDELKVVFESAFSPLLPDLNGNGEKNRIVAGLLSDMLKEERLLLSDDRKRVEFRLKKKDLKSETFK